MVGTDPQDKAFRRRFWFAARILWLHNHVLQDFSVNGRSIDERESLGRLCTGVYSRSLARGLHTSFLLDGGMQRCHTTIIGLSNCRGHLIELSLEGVVLTPSAPIGVLDHDGISLPAQGSERWCWHIDVIQCHLLRRDGEPWDLETIFCKQLRLQEVHDLRLYKILALFIIAKANAHQGA